MANTQNGTRLRAYDPDCGETIAWLTVDDSIGYLGSQRIGRMVLDAAKSEGEVALRLFVVTEGWAEPSLGAD